MGRKESSRPPRRKHTAIGDRLLWSRLAVNRTGTQEEYADHANLTRTTYSAWEVGSRRITLNGALALCKTYNLSLDWIYLDRLGTIDDPDLKKAIAAIRLAHEQSAQAA